MVERYGWEVWLSNGCLLSTNREVPREQGNSQSYWSGGERCRVCGWDHEASEDNHHNIEHWKSTISFYDLTTKNNDLWNLWNKMMRTFLLSGKSSMRLEKICKTGTLTLGFRISFTSALLWIQGSRHPPGACLPTKNLWGSHHRSPEQSWTGMYWFYTNDDVFIFL